MVMKGPRLDKQYVTKSRQKSVNTLGIDEYRRRQAKDKENTERRKKQ